MILFLNVAPVRAFLCTFEFQSMQSNWPTPCQVRRTVNQFFEFGISARGSFQECECP